MKRIVGAGMVTAALTAPGFAADLAACSYQGAHHRGCTEAFH
jgi:hypothetical protein